MNSKLPNFALATLIAWACQSSNDVNAAPETTRPTPETSACSTAVALASGFGAPALFAGAVSCSEEDRQEDTNFLLILGQIRALSDLTVLTPLDDENSRRAGELYGQLYYDFGGFGFDEFYRAPMNVGTLEERIRDADLRLTSDYDPGWAYRSSSKTDIYPDVLSNEREQRIWEMRNMALKLQDDEYYEAHRALAELQRDNPVLQEGTPAFEEHARLMARLRDAERDIPELPQPEDTNPYARLNEQDPDLAERQVAVGFNGPASQGTYIFRSEAEVRQSWLSAALSDQEIAALIARTDFATQILVGVSFGQRMNASGRIMISELDYRDSNLGYIVATRIGVVPESCGFSFTESYPFVVGVAGAVPDAEVRGYSTSNFPDECRPIASGTPSTSR